MKATLYDVKGKGKGKIDLPSCFSVDVREDIISKVLEANKHHQAYGAKPIAGMQSSASGKIVHKRGVWKSQYKRGMSRIPRKIMSRRGSQFNWVGAFVPNARGGRRAHPPKAIKDWSKKINKKEIALAVCSALSATTNADFISERYSTLDKKDIKNAPFIVESKITSLKVKDLLTSLNALLGEKLFSVAIKKRSTRAGKGKMRGRKYKANAGMLLVVGNKEKAKSSRIDIKRVNELSVSDLAKGGPGRLVVYTENAIKDIQGDKK